MRPGQLRLEAVEQVEERPGQDDDVVHAAMQDYHLAGVAETCTDIQGVMVYTIVDRCTAGLQHQIRINVELQSIHAHRTNYHRLSFR